MSSVVSPLYAELAAVGRSIDGIGYAHVHGIFNFTYGVGSTRTWTLPLPLPFDTHTPQWVLLSLVSSMTGCLTGLWQHIRSSWAFWGAAPY